MTFPIEKQRSEFPALAITDHARKRIYLDNPAGTQVPSGVADAVARCLLETNANLGGFFATTVAAQEVVDAARDAMADFLGASSQEEIVIGANMTTLTYHMSRTLGRHWRRGDEIIVTRMDHEGNVSPWLQLAEDRGLTVHFLPFDSESWQVEEDALSALLSDRTKLVALNYASNLTGSINRVQSLTARAKEVGAIVYVDAVQFAPHGLVDVQALGCDFLVCSAYKFFGPHMGILWGKKALIETLVPYKLRCSSNELPERFELGTPQIELMAGLSATVAYFVQLGERLGATGTRREKIAAAFANSIAYESALMRRLIEGLSLVPGVTIHGITDSARLHERVPTVSFTMEGVAADEIARALARDGIFVWSGHNYAWEIVHQLGIPADQGVVRIGIAHYNTVEEVEETVASVNRLVSMLRQQHG